MTVLRHPRTTTWCCWLLAICCSTGCCLARKKEIQSQEPSWTESLREKTLTTSPWGIDPRAKEIERNLGV